MTKLRFNFIYHHIIESIYKKKIFDFTFDDITFTSLKSLQKFS